MPLSADSCRLLLIGALLLCFSSVYEAPDGVEVIRDALEGLAVSAELLLHGGYGHDGLPLLLDALFVVLLAARLDLRALPLGVLFLQVLRRERLLRLVPPLLEC